MTPAPLFIGQKRRHPSGAAVRVRTLTQTRGGILCSFAYLGEIRCGEAEARSVQTWPVVK